MRLEDVCLSDIFSFNYSHQTTKTKRAKPVTGSKNPLLEPEEAEQSRYLLDHPSKSLAFWFRLRLGSSSRWSPFTCRSCGLPKRSFSNRSSSYKHLGKIKKKKTTTWKSLNVFDHVMFFFQVPFLLGLFYCTVGLLQLLLDETTSIKPPRGNLDKTVISLL